MKLQSKLVEKISKILGYKIDYKIERKEKDQKRVGLIDFVHQTKSKNT